jgi:hypothetical protein
MAPFSFIVSRREHQDRVWICSGTVSGDDDQPIARGYWFRKLLIAHLCAVFPALRAQQTKAEWGVYSGRLVSVDTQFPGVGDTRYLGTRKYVDMGIDRLLVCYTDRLTIAPRAAENVAATVAARWARTGTPLPNVGLPPIDVLRDYWQVPLLWERRGVMRWREFELDCLNP